MPAQPPTKKARVTSEATASSTTSTPAAVAAAAPAVANDDASDGEEDIFDTWEDLKELWERAMDAAATQDAVQAVQLLRGLINECDRIVRNSPDSDKPMKLPENAAAAALADAASSSTSPTDPLPSTTGFFHIYATSLTALGQLLAADPALADPAEPAPREFFLVALETFAQAAEAEEKKPLTNAEVEAEAATESKPKKAGGMLKRKKEKKKEKAAAAAAAASAGNGEGWRVQIAWGRCLVLLASEALEEDGDDDDDQSEGEDDTARKEMASPKKRARDDDDESSLSPNELLGQAAEHYALGLEAMPSGKRSSSSSEDVSQRDPVTSFLPPTNSVTARLQTLLSVANSVAPLVERLADDDADNDDRLTWATWAEQIYGQVIDEANASSSGLNPVAAAQWAFDAAVGQGSVWLGLGSRLADALETGEDDEQELDLSSEEVALAKGVLGKALGFLGTARTLKPRYTAQEKADRGAAKAEQVDDEEDEVAPLLIECCLTLSALMGDEEAEERDGLLEGAREEGWVEEDEEEEDGDDDDE